MTSNFRRAILIFGLLWASLCPVRRGECAEEPHYKGRSLTSWLNDFEYGRFPAPDMDRNNAVLEAVREIGADALPILMQRIQTTSEDHALLLRDKRLRDAQYLQDMRTKTAFEALGAVAHTEIPTLIEWLAPQYDAVRVSTSSAENWLRERSSELAGSVLAAMGCAVVDPLLESLGAEDPRIRFGVMGVLQKTCNDDRIVPAVLKQLRDEDAQIRWMSAQVLGTINTLPETCVPALAELLRDDPEVNVRCFALMALRKFGPRAEAALPEVMAATSDENSSICYYARNALKAIRPEAKPGACGRRPSTPPA